MMDSASPNAKSEGRDGEPISHSDFAWMHEVPLFMKMRRTWMSAAMLDEIRQAALKLEKASNDE